MSTLQTALRNEALVRTVEEDRAGAAIHAERTDAQLVELVLAGSATAFECLFDRHKRLVASIASRFVRKPEQIEEAIQIAFSKAFIELRRFRGDHDNSFVGWLAKITTNTCLDLLRSQKRKPENLLEDVGALEHLVSERERSSEDRLIEKDLADKLLAHVAADDRALLHMLYSEEMSMAEIASQFGWSISKTKIRAWRARHSLRRVIKRLL